LWWQSEPRCRVPGARACLPCCCRTVSSLRGHRMSAWVDPGSLAPRRHQRSSSYTEHPLVPATASRHGSRLKEISIPRSCRALFAGSASVPARTTQAASGNPPVRCSSPRDGDKDPGLQQGASVDQSETPCAGPTSLLMPRRSEFQRNKPIPGRSDTFQLFHWQRALDANGQQAAATPHLDTSLSGGRLAIAPRRCPELGVSPL
jgi:hypothetical protein